MSSKLKQTTEKVVSEISIESRYVVERSVIKGLIFLGVIMNLICYSQTAPEDYRLLVTNAKGLYKTKNFCESATEYQRAFQILKGGFPNDRYNAACCYARCGLKDSAFVNLLKIVHKAKFSDVIQLSNDNDLLLLHDDVRWNHVIEQTKINRYQKLARYHLVLIKRIDSLIIEDQKWRQIGIHHDNDAKKLPEDSVERNVINRNITLVDRSNYSVLVAILKEYGYPNIDLVGEETSNHFWALIQHQDRRLSFQDSVLRLLKAEADRGKASKSNYAYLLDRSLVNKGKKQVYGTQMRVNKQGNSYEPCPVRASRKLNLRRAQMGLISEEEYIKIMNAKHFGNLKK